MLPNPQIQSIIPFNAVHASSALSVTEESAAELSVAELSAAEQSATEFSVADRSAAELFTAEQSCCEQFYSEQPARLADANVAANAANIAIASRLLLIVDEDWW